MTSYVRKMYKEAKNNEEFNTESKEADPKGYNKPNMFSDEIDKHVYISVYYGWLIARGEFDRSRFEN